MRGRVRVCACVLLHGIEEVALIVPVGLWLRPLYCLSLPGSEFARDRYKMLEFARNRYGRVKAKKYSFFEDFSTHLVFARSLRSLDH